MVRGLYQAPEPSAIARSFEEEDERRGGVADRAMSDLERRFGEQELAATKMIDQRILEDARRRGVLTRSGSQAADG